MAATYAGLRDAVEAVRRHGPARAPDDFLDRVLAAVDQEDAPAAAPWWRRPFGIPVEGLAVAAAAVIVVVLAMSATEEVDPTDWEAPATKEGEVRPAAARTEVEGSVAPAAPYAEPTKSWGGAKGSGFDRVAKTAEPVVVTVPDPVTEAAPPVEPVDGAGASEEQVPPSGVRYTVHADDPAVLAQLQRLVARHAGRLQDGGGGAVTAGAVEGASTTLTVTLPDDALLAFGDDLRGLGIVEERIGETDLYRGGEVPITIEIRVPQVALDK